MRILPGSERVAGSAAGCSTRLGGVSLGRYSSLNLGERWGDLPAHVAENRRRLAADGGFDLARLTTARQVHRAGCEVADGRDPAEVALCEADAVCTSEPGRAVGVYTADCVPLLLADGQGRVAAAHAGWRGTVAEVAKAALAGLMALGAARGDIHVLVGPCIGPCCFEVGEEVAAEFERVAPRAVLRHLGEKPHVDLRRANLDLLEAAGVRNVTVLPACTRCDAERFFSYRRDGAGIGQMLSFIVGGLAPVS
jgi:YfiH family protein